MYYLDLQFQSLIELLFSPLGLLLLACYAVFCVLTISSPKLRWVALVLLFWSTTLTRPTTIDTLYTAPPLIGPLETIRLQARAFSSAMVLALVLPALLTLRGWRRTIVPVGVVAYLAFQLTFSTLELVADVSAKTLLSGLLFTATFVAVGVGCSKWVQTVQDANRLLWAAVVAMGLFCAATCLQLAINPSAAIAGKRLMGTTANPQFAAIILASIMLPAIYLLLDKSQAKAARISVGVLIGVLAVFLYWTGSRTGLLMAGVGALAFFRLKLGKLVFAGMIGAVFTAAAFFIFGEASAQNTERFLGLEDSRTFVWARQWALFVERPITGTFTTEGGFVSGGGENSYLTVAASYGIIGLIPMFVMMWLMGAAVLRTFRLRRYMPERAMLIDLVLAGFVSAAVGAFFEAFLLGQFNLIVFLLFIYAAIAAFIRDEAAAIGLAAHAERPEPALGPTNWSPQY